MGAAAADAFHLRRLDEDDHSDDDHSDDDHADDHHADDHHADDHSDDDHADDGHGDDGHGDDGPRRRRPTAATATAATTAATTATRTLPPQPRGRSAGGVLKSVRHDQLRMHYKTFLLQRFTSELMVLGFLAFSVWVSLKSGFIKFLSGGRDVKWGPQTDIQLKETIEEAHMGIFVAMTIYFAALTTICDQCTAESDRTLQYERLLAMERSKGGQVVKTPHDGRLSVVKVAAVVTQSAKNLSLHDYKMLREAFVRAGNNRWSLAHGAKASEFNDDFHFALYLRVHLDALIMELIEIQPTTWIFVIFLLIIHAALARSQLLGEWIIYFPPLAGIAMLVALHVALTFYERIYCDEDRVRRSRLERAASGKLAVSKTESNHDLEDMLLRVIQALLLFCMYSVGQGAYKDLCAFHADKAHHAPGDHDATPGHHDPASNGAQSTSTFLVKTRHGERQESSSGAVDDSLAAFAELAEDDDGRPPGTKVVAVDDVRAEDYAPPDDAALPPLQRRGTRRARAGERKEGAA
ncbi:hypothetical protein JL720_16909 [Aureococcus anophagefferens]|nr:hypothetical protein JL720_16909 [Aureococcus anophagefferens]